MSPQDQKNIARNQQAKVFVAMAFNLDDMIAHTRRMLEDPWIAGATRGRYRAAMIMHRLARARNSAMARRMAVEIAEFDMPA